MFETLNFTSQNIVRGHMNKLGEQHENLSFEGSLNSAEDVKVSNACVLSGSIQVNSIEANNLEIEGIFGANNIKTQNCSFKGNFQIESINSVNTKTDGALVCKHLESASLEGLGNLTAEQLTISSALNFEGSVSAKSIKSKRFELVGNIKAESLVSEYVKIALDSNSASEIGEIRASTVVVSSNGNREKLVSRLIEGQELTIENVKADKISGHSITIGANCEINELFYSDKVLIHDSAIVRSKIKL